MDYTKTDIQYFSMPGHFASVSEDLVQKCSKLYSNHYGIWGEKGPRPGERVVLSGRKIAEWLDNDNAMLYFAKDHDELIGYAISLTKNTHGQRPVSWVTQLVVHKDYRHIGVAKNLLFSIWGLTNRFAWGIVSANPYAIRALEKATRRRAMPVCINKHKARLLKLGVEEVPFIDENTKEVINNREARINTEFYVDHSETNTMIENVVTEDVPWTLGDIGDGWEWFAFTFQDQEQLSLTKEEIETMLMTSDSVVKQAYSLMNLDEGGQKWMKNTSSEVDYILSKVKLQKDDIIIDVGCGTGRHSIEFARRGYSVIAVDYIDNFIKHLEKKATLLGIDNITATVDDCRNYRAEKKAALAVCLYDVVGTYANIEDNKKIIETVYDNLVCGGCAVFSVMNYESTLKHAVHTFSLEDDANRLLELMASNTMEQSGEVFNPDFYLVDTNTHLVYRKEQFSLFSQLPVELIVRDRRFSKEEICGMIEEAGFDIVESKYTNASGWNNSFECDDRKAKEILVVARKR